MVRPPHYLLTAALLIIGGCTPIDSRLKVEQDMFGAVSFRVHPTFTQIKNWTGGPKPDGIEAVVEFEDQFGDPTRAVGKIRFELYTFYANSPDHRGGRLAFWSASLESHDDQIARWDTAARGYSFQLVYDKISTQRAYVLTAQVDRGGTRLFDELIIEPTVKEGYHGDRRTQKAPTDAPGHSYND